MYNSIAVFCGSKQGNNLLYKEHAAQLGFLLASNKIQMIYGGGRSGLMGIVANAVLQNNGNAVGVIPAFMNEKEHQHEELTALHIVENMHARKKMMYELCDAAVILPGGYGTLDEMFEIITWNQLSIHNKTLFVLNSAGFYDRLFQHINFLQQEGFLYTEWKNNFTIVDHPHDIFSLMHDEDKYQNRRE